MNDKPTLPGVEDDYMFVYDLSKLRCALPESTLRDANRSIRFYSFEEGSHPYYFQYERKVLKRAL